MSLVVRYSCFFALLSALLLSLGFVFEESILTFVGRSKVNGTNLVRTVTYFRWQLAGIVLLCSSYPLSTYLGMRANLKSMFFRVFVPWLFSSVLIYAAAARQGAMFAAQANLAVYAVLMALLLIFNFRGFGAEK